MGLLDPKTRIVDAILTAEGRRQLAAGGLDVAFYAFDDACAQYRVVDGVYDYARAASLEASDSPHDILFARSDETGVLLASASGSVSFAGGRVTSDNDAATQEEIIVAVDPTNALRSHSLLHSIDVFEDQKFEIGPEECSFFISDDAPVPKRQRVLEADHADPLFADIRLSHIDNFKFLPPLTADGQAGYPRLGAAEALAPSEHVSMTETAQERVFTINPHPLQNDIAVQMLCVRDGEIVKLHAVDAGSTGDDRVVFFGKLCRASAGHVVFVRLFTLIMQR